MKFFERIIYVSKLLKENCFSVSSSQYKPGSDPASGWYRIKSKRNSWYIVITEFISNGLIIKYSYVLLKNKVLIMRYDNAPHHRKISTYPHHKHLEDKVFPVEKWSIEAFIREALDIISRK